MPEKTRCDWSTHDPEMVAYHDQVWGVPQRDDRALFEFLTLEGAQAGLSWSTILHKRKGYLKAFENFDASVVANYDEAKIAGLLADPGIIRNRLKVRSTVTNAAVIIELREAGVSLSDYLWAFVDGAPIVNRRREMSDIPAVTDEAAAMSKALKKRGFRFVGPTICYALMQACGMVNDHVVDCFRYSEVSEG
jgi:DNA-3-methyladenine glycosylase I